MSAPPAVEWPPPFVRTSDLSAASRARIDALLADEPWFRFYWRASLADLARGVDNRAYALAPGWPGLVLAIRFADVAIFSTVGAVDDGALAAAVLAPARAELHLRAGQWARASALAAGRVEREDTLCYMRREDPAPCEPDPRCRALGRADLGAAQDFFRAHYPETVFSAWMLENPFVGLFEDGALVAAAGAIAVDDDLAACHVGNFLVRPDRRGRGLARAVGAGLIETLRRRGVRDVMLGVERHNEAARRVYRALGFRDAGERTLVHLRATAEPAGGG